jgi:TPR repeat protein
MAPAHRLSALVLAGLAYACAPGCAVEADPDAVAEQGRTYMTGASGHPVDPAKARQMFEAAAQKGSGAGLFYLGLLAFEGDGRAPDLAQACGLFRQSSERNHPGGLREYGECQLRGLGGVKRDPAAAAESFRKSIAHGGIQAHESLARLYLAGEGVPRDPAEAARLMQRYAALRSGRN